MPTPLSDYGFDHTVVLVHDLDAAADQHRRLGFHVAPRSHHDAVVGTGNHIIVVDNIYYELLGVLTPTPANEQFRARLARGEGLWLGALTTSDVATSSARLRAANIDLFGPVQGARQMQDRTGQLVDAVFRTAFPLQTQAFGMGVFYCEHLDRGLTFDSRFQSHPNGATSVSEVAIFTHDLESCCELLERVVGRERLQRGADLAEINLDNLRLTVLTPEAANNRYRALGNDVLPPTPRGLSTTFQVADLQRTQSLLTANGVAFVEDSNRLLIHPRDASGAIVEFCESSA